MYDKISATPGEHVSFIEFCHKGHRAIVQPSPELESKGVLL